MALDTTVTDNGYLLGRLLATIERVHYLTHGGNTRGLLPREYTWAFQGNGRAFAVLLEEHTQRLATLGEDQYAEYDKLTSDIVCALSYTEWPKKIEREEMLLMSHAYYNQRAVWDEDSE